MKKILSIVLIAGLMNACVPISPKPTIGLGTGIGTPKNSTQENSTQATNSAYGLKPKHYFSAIKSYFSTKLKRADKGQYKFSEPKRAYKQKGFAYGGALAWKGWLVETSVAIPSRTGRYLTPKPYMVLFKGEQIVEHILGNSHKLLTKVD